MRYQHLILESHPLGHKVLSFVVALLIEGRADLHQAQVLGVFPRTVNFTSIVDISFRLGDCKHCCRSQISIVSAYHLTVMISVMNSVILIGQKLH